MKSILLVEDDPFLIDIYTTKLNEAGYEVEVVSEGEAVFKKLKEKNAEGKKEEAPWPDLVLLDIVLPKKDGWEILKQIKEDSQLKNLKVIILSNLGQKAEVEKGMEMGASGYLIKAQYTPSDILKEIEKFL